MTFADALATDYRRVLVGEYSSEVTIRASGRSDVLVAGIFDESYLEVDPGTGATVASKKPRVTVWISDVGYTPDQGHSVLRGATTYAIRDVQPDGMGGVVLYLD